MAEKYQALGVDIYANGLPTAGEVERIFRKAALNSHPDKGGRASAFQKVNEAHQYIRSHQDKINKLEKSYAEMWRADQKKRMSTR